MMVDRNDLGRVQTLYAENGDIGQALANFEAGGGIVRMTIGPTEVTIDTTDIEYPPQMVEAIKAVLMQRQHAIVEELEKLGLTGVGEGERPEPPPPRPDPEPEPEPEPQAARRR